MCGIAGWVGTRKDLQKTLSKKKQVVKRILSIQSYRGPDASGLWEDNKSPAVIGHNRLSILELSEAGAQPMQSSNGRWVISYNGELYNYKSLRTILEKKHNVVFKGNSDTEVFLYGVIFFGLDEFLRLADGMFSVALYDTENKELILARDRVGEKPLFFKADEEGLFFGSELKALVKGIEARIKLSLPGLQMYTLFRYVPAPMTIIEGVKKLQPGHYLRYKYGRPVIQVPYYSWDPHASMVPASQANYVEVVKATEKYLIKSLESRLMSDVPLGFFLSGGVDSTLCAALTRKNFGKEIHTYTIGFEGDASSEHPISEKTASVIGAKHKTQILKQSDLYASSVEYIRKLDEPNGDRSLVPTYLLCKHARSDVTVALGGDGGDELFSGYTRYPGLNKMFMESNFDNPVEVLKVYYSSQLPVFGMQSTPLFGKLFPETELFLSSMATNLYPPSDIEQSIRYVDFRSYLPGAVLSKVDRMSMLASLEVRTPFLLRLYLTCHHDYLTNFCLEELK